MHRNDSRHTNPRRVFLKLQQYGDVCRTLVSLTMLGSPDVELAFLRRESIGTRIDYTMFPASGPSPARLWGRRTGLVISVVLFSLLSALGLISFPAFRLRATYRNENVMYEEPSDDDGKSCCDLAVGKWQLDVTRSPHYSAECPFLKDSVNCVKNRRPGVDALNRWSWVPKHCELPQIRPAAFLRAIKNMNIGFIGDSMNENFVSSLLCILRVADGSVQNWTLKGSQRSAFFPMYNVTVGFHRANLLASYEKWHWNQSPEGNKLGLSKGTRVDVDVPAKSWSGAAPFYHVLVLNTGHWWSVEKFPPGEPLLFFKGGKPIFPPLDIRAGLEVVVRHMVSFVEHAATSHSLKLWRTQSPRHFEGGGWHENGSCTSGALLNATQVEAWFSLDSGGVNREERELNNIVRRGLRGSAFKLLDVAAMSEFRRDAHPGAWSGRYASLGLKNVPQDCSHWCLPGVPDVWADMLAFTISHGLSKC